jgi:hypothetical protein
MGKTYKENPDKWKNKNKNGKWGKKKKNKIKNLNPEDDFIDPSV